MAKVKILGMEHREGVNKSTNRPYDFDLFHVVSVKPLRGEERVGHKVDQVMVNRSTGLFADRLPAVNEDWVFDYNSDGFLEDAYPVE